MGPINDSLTGFFDVIAPIICLIFFIGFIIILGICLIVYLILTIDDGDWCVVFPCLVLLIAYIITILWILSLIYDL